MTLRTIDIKILHFLRNIFEPAARLSIFVIFFWFGALKVLGLSPASLMVSTLLHTTMPFFPPDLFLVCFGSLECVIGILFLIRGAERIAFLMLILHMVTTAGPLLLLPHMVWTGMFVPTLEGQYIIKNLAIIAAAIGIAAHLHPLHKGEYI